MYLLKIRMLDSNAKRKATVTSGGVDGRVVLEIRNRGLILPTKKIEFLPKEVGVEMIVSAGSICISDGRISGMHGKGYRTQIKIVSSYELDMGVDGSYELSFEDS